MTTKKSPIAKTGQVRSGAKNINHFEITNNDTQAQRQRLLDYLCKVGSVTTITCRQELNIMHPAGRVMELRKLCYKIETHWLNDVTPEGHKHRIANYILQGEDITSDAA